MKPQEDQTIKPRIFVDSAATLETTLHELIPISQAMGITVDSYENGELVIRAPLAPNQNHQHSAFGGSLFAVAALTGWGLMQLKLSELLLDCNTVVMGGEVSYQRPVYDDLVCRCCLPAGAEAVFDELKTNGTAITTLSANFYADEKIAMTLQAKYHLKQRKKKPAC